MTTEPRHSRKEIRDFAAWLRKQGWTYESTDAKGHTIWSHPKSTSTYKLSEKNLNVQRARHEVLRMIGQKIEGKRRPKPPPKSVTSEQLGASTAARPRPAPKRPTARRLPWEGAHQPDNYNRGIAALMREIPRG